MPETLDAAGRPNWRAAVDQIEASLAEKLGAAPQVLDRDALAGYPLRSPIAAGWRIPMAFPDGTVRRLDVLVREYAPLVRPLIALVDRPPFYTWPHVERDGVLCLLPNVAEADLDNPALVALNMLGKGARLVEELIQGDIVERDFRDEFLTYWNYDLTVNARINSLIAPAGPTREIRVWRGRDFNLVAETDAQIEPWLANYLNQRLRRKDRKTETGVLLWLDKPPLPSDYPYKSSDVWDLAQGVGGGAPDLLARAAQRCADQFVVIIGADGRNGPGLVSVIVRAPGKAGQRRSAPVAGFRKYSVPSGIAALRYFSDSAVERGAVNRADGSWIHGRGQDVRTERLLSSSATVVGCGSVGAPVAISLGQAGVGTINLVDAEPLEWANVGRHPLGARSVRRNKASELAIRIRSEFPHLKVNCIDQTAQWLVLQNHDALRANVVIAATGSWAAECVLNDWHVQQGRKNIFVYGWTETHACAGHAVAIAKTGGCLRTGIDRTGVPRLQVTSWPEGGGAREEPACGAHYFPYGPIELGYVNATIADLVLDSILGTVNETTHRVWVARHDLLQSAGGELTRDGVHLLGQNLGGGVLITSPWPAMAPDQAAAA